MLGFRNKISKVLLESYKHKNPNDSCCAICGCTDRQLAFHVIEDSFDVGIELPPNFVPLSVSRGKVRGSYPVCSKCSPPCIKCGLPIENEVVMEFSHKINYPTGRGVCRHMHISVLLIAIFKRIFKMGRFGK